MSHTPKTHYIVNTTTWHPMAAGRPYPMPKVFTERGAKMKLTQLRNKGGCLEDHWEVMSIGEWDQRRPMVEVNNLMSGKKVMEKAGTPGYLSVASERYWSM